MHSEIVDGERWNRLVAASPVETLYPYSWYLDHCATNWGALVAGDYEFIMPLVWKKRLGISHLYQPTFCQQLGVLGMEEATSEVVREFVAEAMKHFPVGHLQLNRENHMGEQNEPGKVPVCKFEERNNFILRLDGDHRDLQKVYNENTRRNLKKAMDRTGPVEKVALGQHLEFKRKCDEGSQAAKAYGRMERIFGEILKRKQGIIYGVKDGEELVASALMAFSTKRLIYLQSVSNHKGKEQRAMFRIVDEVIREHAGSGLVLDFEGSMIPSIARFFAGFGASAETYTKIVFNRLPLKHLSGRLYGS